MADSNKSDKDVLAGLLPESGNGWVAKESDQIYDPETIFDYIDGAGEVYRSYNFKLLLARHFEKAGAPGIFIDLFDMGSSKDAFGVFTHDPEGEETGVGQSSAYKGGLLSFWKGRYFVSIYTEQETPETKNAVINFGRTVDAAIKDEGKLPGILDYLPEENLIRKNMHYFHTHLILNYHFFVADKNILLLDQETDAVLASYMKDEDMSRVLIIRYQDIEKASQAYSSFTKTYMPDAKKPGWIQTENKKWTAASIQEKILICLFDMPDESYTAKILGLIVKKIADQQEREDS
jgi:hypothetical protein